MSAAGVAGEGQAVAVDAVRLALLVQVLGDAGDFLNRYGELRLGRKTVVHGCHRGARLACQDAADAIMRVQVAQDEAAAVRVDDRRQGLAVVRKACAVLGGVVQANGDVPMRALDLAVDLLGHFRAALYPVRTPSGVVQAHLLEAGARVVGVSCELVFLGEHRAHALVDFREDVDLVHVSSSIF